VKGYDWINLGKKLVPADALANDTVTGIILAMSLTLVLLMKKMT